jgi:signal transduction histidine kinase
MLPLLRQEGNEGPLIRLWPEADYVAELNILLGGGAAGRALPSAGRSPSRISSHSPRVSCASRTACPRWSGPAGTSAPSLWRLSVPLITQDDLMALSPSTHKPRQFSEEEQRLALSVAHQAARPSKPPSEQAEEAAALAERSRLAREPHDRSPSPWQDTYAEAAPAC